MLLSILALVGGSLFRLGRLTAQVDQLDKRAGRLEVRVEQVAQEVRAVSDELRGEMREMRDELRGEMRELREEMRAEMREMREEMRRNHEQLLMTLANHGHDETGQAIFRNPL